jgi:hypothetical protein
MAHPRILADWELVTSYLPPDWEVLADEHKQVQTQYGNAKIRTASELLRLILVHAACDLPLRETVALVAEAGGPDIAPMRLHKKMIRAVEYLRALVTRMVRDLPDTTPEQWAGYDVVVADATTASRPGSLGADVRVHTLMRLSNLEYVDVQVTNMKVGETLGHFPLEFGQLVLGDRGYCCASSIFGAAIRGADVLVRLNRGSTPLWDAQTGERVDVLAAMRALEGHAVDEQEVTLEWTDREQRVRRLEGRLILQRLPDAEAAKARKRLRDELKSAATADSLEAAGYVALLTTVKKSRLSGARCMHLYRLRWQIELLFKRLKSLCGLDRVPNYRPETIKSWIYAKLLVALLLDRMASSSDEVFPPAGPAVVAA